MNYDVVFLAKQGLLMALVLSMPVITVATVVGLLFSIFQTLTQIQDQTVSFTIKLIAIIATLYFTVDWTAVKLFRYALLLYAQMIKF